jgi:hypothetical protein
MSFPRLASARAKKELKKEDAQQPRSDLAGASKTSREAVPGRETIRYVLVDAEMKGNGITPSNLHADIQAENTGPLRANYRLTGWKKRDSLHPKSPESSS